jgi:hypothetical protein
MSTSSTLTRPRIPRPPVLVAGSAEVTVAELRAALVADGRCPDPDALVAAAREMGAPVLVGGRTLTLKRERPADWFG